MSLKCKNGRGGGNGLIKQNTIRDGGSYMLYAANAVDTVDSVDAVDMVNTIDIVTHTVKHC